MNSAISSSVMTIVARWLLPTRRYFQVATGVTVTGMAFSATGEAQPLINMAYWAATCC
jgi:hypothetical protein